LNLYIFEGTHLTDRHDDPIKLEIKRFAARNDDRPGNSLGIRFSRLCRFTAQMVQPAVFPGDSDHLGAIPKDTDSGVRERLTEAVDGLPEIYRTVFLMYDLEGVPHKEIAEALDVAVGTSKARLSRARELLREALGDAMKEYARDA
jgi:DNA-directed RNA polymerase specialized sigma24 family protein